MLKTALVALAALTLLAVGYLTASVLVLRPPRANLSAWLPFAALLATQCVLTFAAASSTLAWLRLLVAAGGTALMAAGVWLIRGTVSSDHFEGYALLLGGMLAVQGALTVAVFLGTGRLRHAMH
jgi:hypothetical protein